MDNPILKLNTVSTTLPIRFSAGSPGNLELEFDFDEKGAFTIHEAQGSEIEVSGSGNFVEDGSEWGGKKRDMIVFSYSHLYQTGLPGGNYTWKVSDTLVIRDRGVVLETFEPVLVK